MRKSSFMLDTVIFDLDGVLIDSERVNRDCWNKIAADHGYSLDCIYPELIGKGVACCDELMLFHFGAAFPIKELRTRKDALFESILDAEGVPLKGGIKEVLHELRRAGYALGMATGSTKSAAKRKLAPHGIQELFDACAYADEVSRGKPWPDLFQLAARKLDSSPRNCLVIEDSFAGIEAAFAAEMRVIMVPDLQSASEKYVGQLSVCNSIGELPSMIARSFSDL